MELITGAITPALDMTAELDTAVETTTPPPQESLALFLPDDKIAVNPGEQVDLKVEVVNRGQRADRVSLRVQGIPSTWVKTPGEFVTVLPGDSVQMSMVIQPPRQRRTPTGRQRLRLELVS